MRRRMLPVVVTLAILLPGLIAGTVVAYYYVHSKHTAPAVYLPRPRAVMPMNRWPAAGAALGSDHQ